MSIPEWMTFGASEWGLFFAAVIWLVLGIVMAGIAVLLWVVEAPWWARAPVALATLLCAVSAAWIFLAGG